ncbi:MAG: hypothetical protein L6Q51_13650 [Cyclobacteriaceae bacterium]|nr:hypothetical protein [Cyclobacteriaceae bacterium]
MKKLFMLSSISFSQNIDKLTSSSVPGTVCPVEDTSYEVINIPQTLSSCKISCSVVNGVPFQGDWAVLVSRLGGQVLAGGKLKQVGTELWHTPNEGAMDLHGFTALPAGKRNQAGEFEGRYYQTGFWTSTTYVNIFGEVNEEEALNSSLSHQSTVIGIWDPKNKQSGLACRCIKG